MHHKQWRLGLIDIVQQGQAQVSLPSHQDNHHFENEVAQNGAALGGDKTIPIALGVSCFTVLQLHSFLRTQQLPLTDAVRKIG